MRGFLTASVYFGHSQVTIAFDGTSKRRVKTGGTIALQVSREANSGQASSQLTSARADAAVYAASAFPILESSIATGLT